MLSGRLATSAAAAAAFQAWIEKFLCLVLHLGPRDLVLLGVSHFDVSDRAGNLLYGVCDALISLTTHVSWPVD